MTALAENRPLDDSCLHDRFWHIPAIQQYLLLRAQLSVDFDF